ncbi:Nif3-like dinuclear metal center hexameric protein [Floccifex sp.]|uniref:Nif3-like dinuclear metal center hexameric protein n=1 Tax=Floccifex sp. TaxID=2815810 RepID=UPI002A750F40|nr:Nif3-like dinuclear metal center hexameric protein [Floccifex sp.]MDD7280600.1 Nif3-like dinuclear metal center hexameric protein [Erysipelotrichaceae bacterium]MDY2958874.1 Nif3-like dinuclear metal center hexameric protein [Floccifex sp.]
MKINTMIENIKKYHKGYGTIDDTTSRDQVLFGNPDQECTGIVTTCWANVDVIRYTIEKGANFIICHEALFWNHGDHRDWLEESQNEVYLEKKKLLEDNNIVVWRNHDYIHSGIPYNGDYTDGIFVGLAKKMGWDHLIDNPINSFDDSLVCSTAYEFNQEVDPQDLAKQLIDTCNLNGIKLMGNEHAKIKKAAVLFHVFGDAKEAIEKTDKSDIDCLLTMELIDFTYAEYIRDSGMLQKNRVALNMGHFNLEESGMEYMLTYLDEAIGEYVPAWFKQSGDNYKYIVK